MLKISQKQELKVARLGSSWEEMKGKSGKRVVTGGATRNEGVTTLRNTMGEGDCDG